MMDSAAALQRPPDGGWGWVVVLSSFFIHIIIDGITYSFGIIFIRLLEDFQARTGDTALVLSTFVGMTLGSGVVAGGLVNLYGCRVTTIIGALIGAAGSALSMFAPAMWFLYISFGIITGFGFGLVFLPAIVIISYYFEKRRGIATGIACSGAGVGTMVFAPLCRYLIEEYGWRQTFLLLAGMTLQCCVLATTFRPTTVIRKTADVSKESQAQASSNNEQTTPVSHTDSQAMVLSSVNFADHSVGALVQSSQFMDNIDRPCSKTNFTDRLRRAIDYTLFKDWMFIIYLIASCLRNLVFNAPFLYIPDRARELGLTEEQGAYLLFIVGFGNVVGRVVFGTLADTKYLRSHRLFVYATGFIISGVAICVSHFESYIGQAICASIFGAFLGCCVALNTVVLADLLGVERLSSSFGIKLLFDGVVIFIGPPAIGWIHDSTGSYLWSFIVIGLCIAASGLIVFALPWVARLQQRCMEQNLQERTTTDPIPPDDERFVGAAS